MESVLYEPKVLIVLSVVAFLVLLFFLIYVRAAVSVLLALKKARARLAAFTGDRASKTEMARHFSHSQQLLHCWSEYAETLHAQRSDTDPDSSRIRLRSTTPADTFFSNITVVDTRIGTDFFKHLPGILTGIGIIGTFWGLIDGLEGFDAGGSAEELRSKISILLNGVKSAFVASTCAIVAAIVVTALEKFLLNLCYSALVRLNQKIDELYQAGAGEEYLARLVSSSEGNSAHTETLKDALIHDVRESLAQFSMGLTHAYDASLARHVDRQILAQRDIQGHLAETIAAAVGRSIGLPTEEFSRLIERLSAAGANTTAGMAAQMEILSEQAEQRQQRMNQALMAMLGQIHQSVKDAQSESVKGLTSTMSDLSGTVETLIRQVADQRLAMGEAGRASMVDLQGGLANLIEEVRRSSQKTSALYEEEFQRLSTGMANGQKTIGSEMVHHLDLLQRRADEFDGRRQQHIQKEVSGLVEVMGDTIATLTAKVAESVSSMTMVVQRLEGIVVVGSETMVVGAGAIRDASAEIGAAGTRVAQALSQGATLFHDTAAATTESMGSATAALKETIAIYRPQREQSVVLMTSLQSLLHDVEARAAAGKDIVNDMTAIVAMSRDFREQSQKYLDTVADLLGNSFAAFADLTANQVTLNRDALVKDTATVTLLFSQHLNQIDESLQRLIETINTHTEA